MSNKIHKIGIIGAGMIAQFHAEAIKAMPNAELVAVYNRNLEKATAFAEQHQCQAYNDLDTFLANDDMQVVTICTPSGAHLDPGLAAAKAGKHIIVEKPIEVTTDKTDALIQACNDQGVQLIGILPRRFNQSTQILKDAVDNGRFGQITLAEASIKWFRTQEYYDSGAWRGTWALDGGGALMNQSIHTVDLLLHVMGNVTRVCAFAGLEGHKDIEVEDVLVAILQFENGARGVIQASTTCYSETGHPAQVQICGMQGSAFMVDDKFSVWDFQDKQDNDGEILKTYGVNASAKGAGAADPKAIDFSWHQRNFEEALAAIDENRPSIVDGQEGRKAIELIGAIYQSAANGGQPVSLPLQSWPQAEQLTQAFTGKS
ncbi:oxidoreductase [Saccharobesus litoralis]|uniref:Oxidoreductase n=1 Tax=Saccharobesus litoralis TaxID=2172099 RepID=A0A2S0VMG9_9ALTE|nr:Gfo/Idh/MocA family oxidoreductase [Saccharobesus litoralis]AWB65395.1 oxidoreductase [Saccharobesus litoralis]